MVPPETTTYAAAGTKGQATFEAGPRALGSFRGMNVYETRVFDVYENELPIDLLRRRQQIGEYYARNSFCVRLPFCTACLFFPFVSMTGHVKSI